MNLKFLSGQSLSSVLLPLVLSSLLLIAGCGSSPLNLLTGGGPNVAANTQVGKENNQVLFQKKAPEVVLRPRSRVDTIDQSQTTKNELPAWLWIVLLTTLIAGWVTDTPSTIISKLRKRN